MSAGSYEGDVPFDVKETDLSTLLHPPTQIMINVGDPEAAFSLAALPVDGVGLARMEFIISEFIKIHPMALVHPDRVEDARERDTIAASPLEAPNLGGSS